MSGFSIVKARLFAATTIAVLLLQPAVAQESAVDGEAVTETEAPPIRGTQSGYEDIPEFGGPEAVSSQLKDNDDNREFVYQFDNLQRGLAPYFDWKRSVNDEHGLSMGFS